ncbi:MAG: alpha/beta fold hydrolase [Pirellulaceae bacterium]
MHGNPTWSFYWRNLVTGLRDQWRLVVPDHLGCGLSDKPQDFAYSLERHIDHLVQLVENLDLTRVTLVAHDWGGAIGLGTMLRLPERFVRIVLFNTGAFPPPFIPWRIRLCRIPGLGPLAVQGCNAFARAALTMATEYPERLSPAARAGLLAPYDSWRHRVAIQRFVEDIPTSPAHPTWRLLAEIEQGLSSLATQPVQMIWGMRDWCFTPDCLDRLLQHFPQAEVHRCEDAGHYVVEDAIDRIVPWVRAFLAAH